MKAYSPAQGCPKCGGHSGYTYTMTESHAMGGVWGGSASSGDNGDHCYSLVSCIDCEQKFQIKRLTTMGAIQGQEAAAVQL